MSDMQFNPQDCKNQHSFKSKIARALWNVVWLFLFRPTIPRLGICNLWRISLLRLFGAKIGKHTTIFPSVKIWQPWTLVIGDWVILSADVNCYSASLIEIGTHVVVSQDVFLCGISHDISSPHFELRYAPIYIGNEVWIAAQATILPGVSIGEGAVVGACAVVTKNVLPWSVVAGNPAKVVKKREIKTC